MNPVAAERGYSFKGLAAYLLHDPGTYSRTRMAWTATRNIPTKDPDKAVKCMAWTAKKAAWLKQRAKVAASGRKSSNRVVWHVVFTWHPNERPNRRTMEAAVDGALRYFGLEDHECLMVGHNDKAHHHVHLALNLVHPKHGRVADIYNYKRRLQDYAYQFDPEASKAFAPQRVENVRKRQQGKRTRYMDQVILKAAKEAASFAEFTTVLMSKGYDVAQGRRRVVAVLPDGKPVDPRRHMEKEDKEKFKAWVRAGQAAGLPDVDEVLAQARDEPPCQVDREGPAPS